MAKVNYKTYFRKHQKREEIDDFFDFCCGGLGALCERLDDDLSSKKDYNPYMKIRQETELESMISVLENAKILYDNKHFNDIVALLQLIDNSFHNIEVPYANIDDLFDDWARYH